MAVITEIPVDAQIGELAERRPFLSVCFDLIRRQPLGAAGALIVFIMIAAAGRADGIAPYDPVINAYDRIHLAPSLENWLGTDQFGRDILSRIIYGARTALFVGFACAFVGATTGLVLGVASAYFGGYFDLLFQRVMDVFMAFPLIILALALVAIFGGKIENDGVLGAVGPLWRSKRVDGPIPDSCRTLHQVEPVISRNIVMRTERQLKLRANDKATARMRFREGVTKGRIGNHVAQLGRVTIRTTGQE